MSVTTTINAAAGFSTQIRQIFENGSLAFLAFLRLKIKRVSLMYDIYTERQEMRKISAAVLQDMGITRADLNRECNRGFTDIPKNRII